MPTKTTPRKTPQEYRFYAYADDVRVLRLEAAERAVRTGRQVTVGQVVSELLHREADRLRAAKSITEGRDVED